MKLPNKYEWCNYYISDGINEKALHKFFKKVHRNIYIMNISHNYDSYGLKLNYGNVYKELQSRERRIKNSGCTSILDYKYYDIWPLIVIISPIRNADTEQHKTLVDILEKYGNKYGVYMIWDGSVEKENVKVFPYVLETNK